MIDPKDISCSSSLYDSCGIVFEHQGRIYRALYPRGTRLFDLLDSDGLLDRLVDLGLVRMRRAKLYMAEYERIIEMEKHCPIVPPSMWTNSMLADASQVLCRLSEELLARSLLIWDLKEMANMTFSAEKGPIFLDIGAIHTTAEIEAGALSTSIGSLVDQIAASFYVRLWLAYGPLRKMYFIKRILEYWRPGENGYAFINGLMRRITFDWKMIPGLLKGQRLLYSGRYVQFHKLISSRIEEWHSKAYTETLKGPMEPTNLIGENEDTKKIIEILGDVLMGLDGKVVFDLSPEGQMGLRIAESSNAIVYLITKDESAAEGSYAWRIEKCKPVLPVLCDIWDRSFYSHAVFNNSCDVACILPDIIGTALQARVPVDFVGRILSSITRDVAVVGVNDTRGGTEFPGFVSHPQGVGSDLEFVSKTIGKYFAKQKVVVLGDLSRTLLFFYK